MAYWNSKPRRREKFIERAHAQRQFVAEHKSRPCMDCGKTFPWYAMELDHREDEIKVSAVSNMIGRVGLEKLKLEIQKCDVVCATCHRIRTWTRGQHYKNQKYGVRSQMARP